MNTVASDRSPPWSVRGPAGGRAASLAESECGALGFPSPEDTGDAAHIEAWGILWRSENRLDGRIERLMGDPGHACRRLLFRSRSEARKFIADRYGYIKERPDLRAEPHGWRMPLAVRVRVIISKGRVPTWRTPNRTTPPTQDPSDASLTAVAETGGARQ